MPTKLSLGFSPCPNDTFIFDALIHHKIDTEDLEFDVSFEDVESLNRKAFNAELDITKLSYHAFAYVLKEYVLLDAGSALGFGVGPLLIANKAYQPNEIAKLRIGIPGKYTTANFLFSLAFPEAKNKVEMVFSEIEAAIKNNTIDAGLIIHENRFTYELRGFTKLLDLGDWWEQNTASAIPLGGIVIKRNIDQKTKEKVSRVLRNSVEYAFANPNSGIEFIRSHAQEMSEEVMYQHIKLYVNKYSLDLGAEGKKAVETLFKKATEAGIIAPNQPPLFL